MRNLFWFLPMLLVGCAGYADLGNGRYAKTAFSEHRSPFGTNSGFMRLESCPGDKPGVLDNRPSPTCFPLTEWVPVSSQGQGGQIVSGAMMGLGVGLGLAHSASQIIQNANHAVNLRASTINPK